MCLCVLFVCDMFIILCTIVYTEWDYNKIYTLPYLTHNCYTSLNICVLMQALIFVYSSLKIWYSSLNICVFNTSFHICLFSTSLNKLLNISSVPPGVLVPMFKAPPPPLQSTTVNLDMSYTTVQVCHLWVSVVKGINITLYLKKRYSIKCKVGVGSQKFHLVSPILHIYCCFELMFSLAHC